MSKGEERIIELLLKDGYSFEREKRFGDLKGGSYRFDFYVHGGRPTTCIIEFNGQQHYTKVGKFQHTRKEHLQQKERDRKKISYCLAHNIPIYIIPYWTFEGIHSAKDLFSERFRARDMWHNDRDWYNYQMEI